MYPATFATTRPDQPAVIALATEESLTHAELDERSARLAAGSEERAALLDALVLCKFVRGAMDDLFEEEDLEPVVCHINKFPKSER